MTLRNLLPIVLLAGVISSGCYHPRSIDSYNSTFRQSPNPPGKGDPYGYGGIADGSGGTQTRTSYATDSESSDPLARTNSGAAGRIEEPRLRTTPSPSPTPPTPTR